MKNQKGITLVALVITIIVLLILAGVSISLVVGNNGVLTQASNSVVKNEDATALQEVQMAAADANAAYFSAWAADSTVFRSTYYDTSVFKNNCTGASSVKISIIETAADTGTVNVVYTANSSSKYYFTINVADGAVTEVANTTANASTISSMTTAASTECMN